MSAEKTIDVVKFDLPKKKTKQFCTFETYFCEKYDADLYILINKWLSVF